MGKTNRSVLTFKTSSPVRGSCASWACTGRREWAMKAQIIRHINGAHERKQTALRVERVVLNSLAGSMQPNGLTKEAAEKQNAENHNDCDYDNLDQAHS